jgi:CheY-like chemotaxis protein
MQYIQHVFLADDDADDRVLFYEAIRLCMPAAHCSVANNGTELLEQLNESLLEDHRMVFLDLNMPLKNGHECLAAIRSQPKLCNIPVYIYSTSTNPEDIDLSLAGGADFYIHKPDSFNYLLDIVRHILSLNRVEHVPAQPDTFVLKALAGT